MNEESLGGSAEWGAKQEWRYFSKCHGTIVDKKTSLVAELLKSLCQRLGGTTHLNWGGGCQKIVHFHNCVWSLKFYFKNRK